MNNAVPLDLMHDDVICALLHFVLRMYGVFILVVFTDNCCFLGKNITENKPNFTKQYISKNNCLNFLEILARAILAEDFLLMNASP